MVRKFVCSNYKTTLSGGFAGHNFYCTDLERLEALEMPDDYVPDVTK